MMMLTKVRCHLVLSENIDDQGTWPTANDLNGLIDIIYRNDGKNRSEDFTKGLRLKM
jgi:hypothetical protein